MKSKRQEMIAEIINRQSVETQEELIARLAEAGYNVTQATISRDIRDMKISKVPTGHGTYRYTMTRHEEASFSLRLNEALVSAINRVENASNIVVIHTLPGLAPAVASGVDSMSITAYLGCVAGDDTIILVFSDGETAADFKDEFKKYAKIN